MAMLGVPHGQHDRSDSEAVRDLESVFKSVDIDGEGRIDQASFVTALLSLNVKLPESEIDAIFEELDVDGNGLTYSRFLEFLKIGKIPSSLLNRVKKSDVPRKSIIIDAKQSNKNHDNKEGTGGLLTVAELKKLQAEKEQQSTMDPHRRKMLQRAVVVIKKASMKNIGRSEVIEFLMEKKMNPKDIELAFAKAQEEVMSPDERLKYLQDLSVSREQELHEQQRINKYLTNELTTHAREMDLLRQLLKQSVDLLRESMPKKYESVISKGIAEEVNQKVKVIKSDLEGAEKAKDERAARVHRRDYEILELLATCLSEQQYFHAYLIFHCLDQVLRDSMPLTQEFLSNFVVPNQKDAPIEPIEPIEPE